MTTELRAKLANILARKSSRAGEFTLSFEPAVFPLNLRAQFTGYVRIALEIGCGWGEYTRAWAAMHPQTLVVALEKKLARVLSSSRTQKQERIENIRYMVLDVAWFFEGVFAPGQFDEITINFPDPWPKARHHKHRFVSPDFAASLAHIAALQGKLTFATDNYAYAREALTVFEASPMWQNDNGSFIVRSEISGRPQSYFETLHRAEGALIYFLQFSRQELRS
ncbi:MAG: tRNA (guanine-N7)-methyltransferase [Spirochaetes bacterium]|nr:tRNA (guanine-N7)-methyltransferase [Spirochaetota bacterium]